MNKKYLMILTVLIAVIALIGMSSMVGAAQNHPGFAYVFTNDGVNAINLNNHHVKTEGDHWKQQCTGEGLDQVCEAIPRSSWPDNANNTDKKIIWANFGSGVFALDSKTMKFTKILTGSTSGNWAIQMPNGLETYVAARKPAQEYLQIDADPKSPNFAQIIASVPIPFIPSRLQPGQLGPGPCDAAITSDGKHIWEPDVWHDTVTRIDTSAAAGGFGIGTQYLTDRLVECPGGTTRRVSPFMTTVSLDDRYVFVENLEGGGGTGTESVIDISVPNAPQEIIRFVQSPLFSTMPRGGTCPEYTSVTPPLTGKVVFLDTTTGAEIEVKGGLGRGPLSDEFTKDNKYNFMINSRSDDITVVDMATLSIICTVPFASPTPPPPAGYGASTGDWDMNGEEFLVNLRRTNEVGVITYDDSAVGCAKFTYTDTISLWGTNPGGIVVRAVNASK